MIKSFRKVGSYKLINKKHLINKSLRKEEMEKLKKDNLKDLIDNMINKQRESKDENNKTD